MPLLEGGGKWRGLTWQITSLLLTKKIPDWLIKTTLLLKVKTAIKSCIKVSWALAQWYHFESVVFFLTDLQNFPTCALCCLKLQSPEASICLIHHDCWLACPGNLCLVPFPSWQLLAVYPFSIQTTSTHTHVWLGSPLHGPKVSELTFFNMPLSEITTSFIRSLPWGSKNTWLLEKNHLKWCWWKFWRKECFHSMTGEPPSINSNVLEILLLYFFSTNLISHLVPPPHLTGNTFNLRCSWGFLQSTWVNTKALGREAHNYTLCLLPI